MVPKFVPDLHPKFQIISIESPPSLAERVDGDDVAVLVEQLAVGLVGEELDHVGVDAGDDDGEAEAEDEHADVGDADGAHALGAHRRRLVGRAQRVLVDLVQRVQLRATHDYGLELFLSNHTNNFPDGIASESMKA